MQRRSEAPIVGLFVTLAFCNICFGFPVEMEGYWQGIPEVTPIGPWNSLFNFTILPIAGTTNEWLISDFYEKDGTIIPGTEQQWWVEDGKGMDYCGVVYTFFRIPATVDTNFTESISTETQIQWCQSGCDQLAWTLTLLDSNTLASHFYFANPINHLNVTLKRVTSYQNLAKSIPMRAPCNLTIEVPQMDSISSVDGEIATACPFKHSRDVKMDHSHLQRQMKRLPTRMAEKYEFCYILNEAVEYSISWNFLQDSSELEVALSIPTQSPSSSYLGFGFEPQFPGMIDADIVIGYVDSSSPDFGSCVRSMYVPYYVGPPVDDNSMILSNTDVIVEGNRLTVEFTRPLNTGHHNITIRGSGPQPGPEGVYFFQTMWAIGDAPGSCTATPNYHGNNRGLRVIDWMNPSSIFPDFMKCQHK